MILACDIETNVTRSDNLLIYSLFALESNKMKDTLSYKIKYVLVDFFIFPSKFFPSRNFNTP